MSEQRLVDRAALLEEGAGILRAAGIPEPRREAIRLERKANVEPLLVSPAIGAEEARGYLAGVARRACGEPLEYVTGWTGFRHLVVGCDRRALIPRPETEGLVDLALAKVSSGVVADIGTGTGVIALSLAREGEFSEVIGTDISSAALELAGSNGARLGLEVTWLEGDLIEPLGGRTLDLVVANPPYIARAEMAELDGSVRDWEPELALLSGEDGLDMMRRLLTDVPRVLVPGGWLALEIDARRAESTAAIARQNGWRDVTIHDDLFGRARYLMARREGTP